MKSFVKVSMLGTLVFAFVIIAFIFSGCDFQKCYISVYPNNTTYGTVYGAGSYTVNSDTQIIAVANNGYMFVSWNDGCTDNPRTIHVTSNNSYTANFAPQGTTPTNYTVTTSVNNSVYGSVTGGGSYVANTTVTLTATANYGYKFESWNDGNTNNPRTVVVNSNCAYTAIFINNSVPQSIYYTVMVNSNNSSCGTVSGSGQYLSGSTATISASANSGYKFSSWNDGNTTNPRTITVTSSCTYTATFVSSSPSKVTYTINFVSNSISYSPLSVESGKTYKMPTTNPTKDNEAFVGWGISSTATATWTDPTQSQTATASKTWYAIFVPLTTWDGSFNQIAWFGAGTSTYPYEIATSKQLAYLAYQVNNNSQTYSGKFFKVTENIYLGSAFVQNEWMPIGSQTKYFSGNFDGNNKKIYGLKINSSTQSYKGLFGHAVNATISNVDLTGLTVGKEICGYQYVGGVIGFADTCTVFECSSDQYITAKNYVGGVIGYGAKTTISRSFYTGKITVQNGGCIVGGIVGELDYAISEINNCTNSANIQGTNNGYYIGGIAGYNAGNIVKCKNTGAITCDSKTGGIVGYAASNSGISKSYNTGNVSSSSTDESKGEIGGIVGFSSGSMNISNCYNTGSITASNSSNIGGIIGDGKYATVNCCYNTSHISGKKNVGGIVGSMNTSGYLSYMQYCYNTGLVEGQSYVGGVIGYSYGATLTSCYYLKNCAIINGTSYANGTGTETSASTALDIFGQVAPLATLQSVYNTIYYDSNWSATIWTKNTAKMPELK